jgi:hypothetical protein
LADLTKQLMDQIEAGRLEEANRTLQLINSLSRDPSVCNQATLAALKKARTLSIIQRSHLQRRLRLVQASRLFHPPADVGRTWQIDG